MMRRALKIGLLSVVIGVTTHTAWADEPITTTVAPSESAPIELTYRGQPFNEFVKTFRSELDPASRSGLLPGLVVFGVNGKADVVVPLILDVLDGYNLRVSLMMGEGFDDTKEEIQKPLNEGKLPEGFGPLGFSNADDLRLFLDANRALIRLASRGTSVLVNHLEQPKPLTASRVAAMRALSMEASGDWAKLVPRLVARDELTGIMALQFWGDSDFLCDSDSYDKCVKELLQLQPGRGLIQAVQTLSREEHVPHRKLIVPLLTDLLQKSTDLKVREAVTEALARIPKDPADKPVVVPASAKEEK